MYGFEQVAAQDISIASGTTYSTIAQIVGANSVVIELTTAATAHQNVIQVSNTYTTTAFRNLVGFNPSGVTYTVALSSAVGNETVTLGQICGGMRYMRLMSDIAVVDGHTITAYCIK